MDKNIQEKDVGNAITALRSAVVALSAAQTAVGAAKSSASAAKEADKAGTRAGISHDSTSGADLSKYDSLAESERKRLELAIRHFDGCVGKGEKLLNRICSSIEANRSDATKLQSAAQAPGPGQTHYQSGASYAWQDIEQLDSWAKELRQALAETAKALSEQRIASARNQGTDSAGRPAPHCSPVGGQYFSTRPSLEQQLSSIPTPSPSTHHCEPVAPMKEQEVHAAKGVDHVRKALWEEFLDTCGFTGKYEC